MTTENTIGDHLLGKIDNEQADRQITCNIAASHSITCDCGAVLDEQTVCILQHLEGEWVSLLDSNHRVKDGENWSCVATCCPDCQDSITGIVKKSIKTALTKTKDSTIDPNEIIGKWRWLNWAGTTDI